MMNKMMVSLLLGVLPMTMVAQDDDMYFVPSKKSAVRATAGHDGPTSTYYSGSSRSVDDYNRRGGGSYYQVIPGDTTGNDVIDFSAEQGVYPDSAQTEDFALTRQMTRWDGYTPSETYWQGYSDGRSDALWHSPWYYSSFYPWYDSYWYWNDPWYYRHYGWYSPWYDPWYYGGHYWHHPYWYGGFHYVGGFHHGGGGGRTSLYARNGNTGTIDLRGSSRGRFSSSTTTTRRAASSSTARATTNARSTSGNFSRTSSSNTNTNNNSSNFNRSSSVNNNNSGSFSRSSSGGGFSSGGGSVGGGSRGGGISRGGRR